MKITAVVLHRGSLAHYTVREAKNSWLEAHLLRYDGGQENAPPLRIRFIKNGRHCSGDTKNQELMDDLCAALGLEKQKRGGAPTETAELGTP